MDNRMVQIVAALLISGVVGVALVLFTESEPEAVPGAHNGGKTLSAHSVPAAGNGAKVQSASAARAKTASSVKKDRVNRARSERKTPEEILAKLKSSDPEERIDGFYAIRYPDQKENFDLTPLLGFIQGGVADGNQEVREAAMMAAGEFVDDPRILPVFETALQGTFADEKEEALNHVFNMEWSPEVERLVVFRLWDADEDIREHAFEILEHNNDGDGFDNIADAQKAFESYATGGL